MRLFVLSAVIPLGLALCASPASANPFDTPVPGKPDKLPWRLLHEAERASVFVAVTGRKGDQADLRSMIVSKAPFEEDGLTYDGLAETIAVHCPSKRWRQVYWQSALDGDQNPPPLIRTPPLPEGATGEAAFYLPAPDAGSLRHEQFAIACGEAPLPETRVVNPYRWARERFGVKTPAAKRR
jgi:hypothetical protein